MIRSRKDRPRLSRIAKPYEFVPESKTESKSGKTQSQLSSSVHAWTRRIVGNTTNMTPQARHMTTDMIQAVFKYILYRAMLIAHNDFRTVITEQDIEQACQLDRLVSYVSL
jgi:histone H3/H4